MIVRENNQPESVQELDAQICWMGDHPLNPATALHRAARDLRSQVHDPGSAVQDWTSTRCTANENDTDIGMNDIARIRLRTASPLLVDDYRRNRTTGSFVLIDPEQQPHGGCGIHQLTHA